MANINEAFGTYKQQDHYKYNNYMETLKNKIDTNEQTYYPNSINHGFSDLNTAFTRVKVSNEKYDKITRQYNKPIYGYICQKCNGNIDQHFSIQENFPHHFVRGHHHKLNQTIGQF